MSAAAKRVEFLVAGVQKAGTTALFDYLAELPEIELPDIKEAHFFDDEEAIDWNRPDYGRYHQLFSDPTKLWGEATPIYLYWPNALERVHAYNSAMKLILLFRDPVERAWSQWRMEFARGKETEPFAWCIREGRARMAQGDGSQPGFHRVFSYVERGFYGRQLAYALELFPREQMLVLTSEQLRREPAQTVNDVADFLGIGRPAHAIAPRISRAAPEIAYPSILGADDVAFLHRQFAEELERFKTLTGIKLSGARSC